MTALMMSHLYTFLAGTALVGFGVCFEKSITKVMMCFFGCLVLLKYPFENFVH